MHYLNVIIEGLIVSAIGGLPFGLVNLTVVNISFRNGVRRAMPVAYGAAIIEIIFALTAILAVSYFHLFLNKDPFLNSLIIAVPGIMGIAMLLKDSTANSLTKISNRGFLTGIFLNIISIQVFMFWFIAITWLTMHQLITIDPLSIIFFLSGVGLGKVGVLWIYSKSGKTISSKSVRISGNMNKIIGGVLIITVIIRLIGY